jgi:hypothetical protein
MFRYARNSRDIINNRNASNSWNATNSGNSSNSKDAISGDANQNRDVSYSIGTTAIVSSGCIIGAPETAGTPTRGTSGSAGTPATGTSAKGTL